MIVPGASEGAGLQIPTPDDRLYRIVAVGLRWFLTAAYAVLALAGLIDASGGRLWAPLVAMAAHHAWYTHTQTRAVPSVRYDRCIPWLDAALVTLVLAAIGDPTSPIWLINVMIIQIAAHMYPPREILALAFLMTLSLVSLASAEAMAGNGADWPTVVVAAVLLPVAAVYSVNLGGGEARLRKALTRKSELLELSNGALRESQQRLRAVLASAPVVLLATDREGTITMSEGNGLTVLGVESASINGRSIFEVMRSQPQVADAAARALDGEASATPATFMGKAFAAHCAPAYDDRGEVTGMLGVAIDVSDRERFEAELLHLANHDTLTGLFNRRRFEEEMRRADGEARRYGASGAVIFLDLDQFKDVNDGRGHRAGDEVLSEVGRLLQEHCRETDILARLGGDEFAILLPRASQTESATLAEKLRSVIASHTFAAGGAPLRLTASAGVAFFPNESATKDAALRRADMAMYQAKDSGRNRVHIYDAAEGDEAQAESRIGWHERVRRALEERRLTLFAQPIMHVETGRVAQQELLLRMLDEDGSVIAPGAFLGVAERSGLIEHIDRWVVDEAIRILGDARACGADLRVQINISARAFTEAMWLSHLRQGIAAGGIDPARLIIEITETSMMTNLQQGAAFLSAVKALGCGVALDDFGVGFASFSHLKHLPVDYLKIDGSFIRNLARDSVDQELVRAIVGIAQALGKRTIAEFVEDAESLRLLRAYGVDYAQGYFIGAPEPLALGEAAQAA